MAFFQFQDPYFLLLLFTLPILALLSGKMGSGSAVRFSSISLLKKIARKHRSQPGAWLFAIRLLALAAIIVALARPQLGRNREVSDAEGIDIILTLDLSLSMRALDLSTKDELMIRLDAAKKVLLEFIDKRPHDRIGLVAFGGEAYLASPLTLNHDWLKQNLARLDLGVLPYTGTAIGRALATSVNRLRDQEVRSRVVILMTDGANNRGISPIIAAEAARGYGVKVYTIATGRKGRVPIALMSRGSNRIVRDSLGCPKHGGQTLSDYDEATLGRIASRTGGIAFTAKRPGELEKIYEEIDNLEKTAVEIRNYANFTELFFWPALLGLALLCIEQILLNTRYRRLP